MNQFFNLISSLLKFYIKYQMKNREVKIDIGSNEIRQDKQNMRIVLWVLRQQSCTQRVSMIINH